MPARIADARTAVDRANVMVVVVVDGAPATPAAGAAERAAAADRAAAEAAVLAAAGAGQLHAVAARQQRESAVLAPATVSVLVLPNGGVVLAVLLETARRCRHPPRSAGTPTRSRARSRQPSPRSCRTAGPSWGRRARGEKRDAAPSPPRTGGGTRRRSARGPTRGDAALSASRRGGRAAPADACGSGCRRLCRTWDCKGRRSPPVNAICPPHAGRTRPRVVYGARHLRCGGWVGGSSFTRGLRHHKTRPPAPPVGAALREKQT